MSFDLANWMSLVAGSLKLSELSIPGTHDSAAAIHPGLPADTGFPNFNSVRLRLSTQTRGLRAQLEGGVRFLDLRVGNIGNRFDLYHESYRLGFSFARARDICRDFLLDHPGETIVVSVKEENSSTGDEFETAFDGFVSQTPGLWYLLNRNATLAEVRGKLVLFRRFTAKNLPKGINAFNGFPSNETKEIPGPPRLKIQDQFGLLMTSITSKQSAIEALLNEAAMPGNTDVIYVNYTSAAGTKEKDYPLNAAAFLNPVLRAYFNDRKHARFGILPRDFEAIDFRAADVSDSIDETNSLIAQTNVNYYFLRNKRNNQVVNFGTGEDGIKLITYTQSSTEDADNQVVQFVLSETPPYFYIASRQTGNVIDILGPAPSGTPLIATRRKPSGSGSQLWMLEPAEATGQFYISSKIRSAGVITVKGVDERGFPALVVATRETSQPPTGYQLWSFVTPP